MPYTVTATPNYNALTRGAESFVAQMNERRKIAKAESQEFDSLMTVAESLGLGSKDELKTKYTLGQIRGVVQGEYAKREQKQWQDQQDANNAMRKFWEDFNRDRGGQGLPPVAPSLPPGIGSIPIPGMELRPGGGGLPPPPDLGPGAGTTGVPPNLPPPPPPQQGLGMNFIPPLVPGAMSPPIFVPQGGFLAPPAGRGFSVPPPGTPVPPGAGPAAYPGFGVPSPGTPVPSGAGPGAYPGFTALPPGAPPPSFPRFEGGADFTQRLQEALARNPAATMSPHFAQAINSIVAAEHLREQRAARIADLQRAAFDPNQLGESKPITGAKNKIFVRTGPSSGDVVEVEPDQIQAKTVRGPSGELFGYQIGKEFHKTEDIEPLPKDPKVLSRLLPFKDAESGQVIPGLYRDPVTGKVVSKGTDLASLIMGLYPGMMGVSPGAQAPGAPSAGGPALPPGAPAAAAPGLVPARSDPFQEDYLRWKKSLGGK